LEGELEGAKLKGSGELRLTDPYPYTATVSLAETDLASLARLSPELRPPVAVAGRLTLTAELEGNLGEPPQVRRTGRGRDVVVEGYAIGSLSAKWSVRDGNLRLSDVEAKLYEGKLAGTITVPLAGGESGAAELSFENLDVGKLAQTV